MRIYYPNRLDVAPTITGSSQASASLSASNVAHDHVVKVWRTGTASATETVTFDFGASVAATSAIIFAHTLLGTDSNIELRKSTDNFAANDVLVATFTWAATPMLVTFSTTSSRYWRVKFTKASAGATRDIGRIFIGDYVDFAGLPDWDGFKVKVVDLSSRDRSRGGQCFSSRQPQYREFKLDMTGVSQAQIATLRTLSETVGTHTPFFLTADVGASDEAGEILYLQLSEAIGREADGMGSSGDDLAWASPISAEECL